MSPAEAFTSPKNAHRNDYVEVGRFLLLFLLGFGVLWTLFYGLFREFPYLSSGGEVINRAKSSFEQTQPMFSADTNARRVLILGDSTVLAGFVPDRFDALAAADGLSVSSYNGGFPGQPVFVPELKKIVENRSNVPEFLLLTLPWRSIHFNAFHPLPEDHDTAERLFPFRNLPRDSLNFLVSSRKYGGVFNYYREVPKQVDRMLRDRGYYFLEELSVYPDHELPASFTIDSDLPQRVEMRGADPASSELSDLNEIIRTHNIKCYFVPEPRRLGSRAPALEIDRAFADLLERSTSCKLLGPDYYLYPNAMFSDVFHLNPDGANAYTEAIYRLLSKPLQEP